MFCSKRRLRVCITSFLVLQFVVVLVYFGIVQYPYSPNKDRSVETPSSTAKMFVTGNETETFMERNRSFVPSRFPKTNGTRNNVDNHDNGTNFVADSSNVIKDRSLRIRGTLKAGKHDKRHKNMSTIRKLSRSFTQKRTPPMPVDSGYTRLVGHLRGLLAGDQNFSVANNLVEWFPVNASAPKHVKIQISGNLIQSEFTIAPKNSSNLCFKKGKDSRKVHRNRTDDWCKCKLEWSGPHCSIPDSVLYSTADTYAKDMTVRMVPKKIINAIAFNMEFDLLEMRLHELSDVVDLFVIYESNYTLYGDSKPLRLLERLLAGYLKEFHHKIYYLFLGTFPAEAKSNGWYAEEYERTFIGRETMKHVFGLAPDDLFIYTDADEIPSREAVLFLKSHDGYPEPFGFSLRWSIFGFFWKQNTLTHITSGCSIKMFRYLFSNNAQQLRTSEIDSSTLSHYISTGGKMHKWNIAENGVGQSGWHCSWCLTPEDIKVKLTSAVNADFPRWGNYPEKLKLNYIRKLIQSGTWFDNLTKFDNLVNNRTDQSFAPEFVLKNWERFKYILDISGLDSGKIG